MAKSLFKYHIEAMIEKLPRSITLTKLIGILGKYGITRRTFYRDRAIVVTDVEDIPVERLMIYAKVFNCEITDLINYKVKAKPIVQGDRFPNPLS